MSIYLVFDSIPSARIVDRVVGDPSLMLAAGDVQSSAIMMACGALVRELTPTALVLDSDSLEDRPIRIARAEIGGILEDCHNHVPYRLVLAIPQVEAILFTDREGFERALGRKVADEDWFEGRFRPRAVFRRLLGDEDFEERTRIFVNALDEQALQRMAQHPVVQEIRSFVAEVREPAARRARVRRAG